MDQAEITASPRLRLAFLVVAALMLLLWRWSLVPPIENWNNPYEDGFSYVGVFYADLICLPAGLFLLIGAIAGHGHHVARARPALFVGVGTLCVGDAMGWDGVERACYPNFCIFSEIPAETTDLRAIATLWRVRCVDRRLLRRDHGDRRSHNSGSPLAV